MPSVHADNLPSHQVIKRRRVICERATISKPARAKSRAAALIAELLKDRDPPDANELRCFDLIRRFHRWGWRDTIHALRLVHVPVVDREGRQCVATDGQPLMQRYVWELACFRSTAGPDWNVVTWGVDEESVCFTPLPSEGAARAALRQVPEAVLRRQSP